MIGVSAASFTPYLSMPEAHFGAYAGGFVDDSVWDCNDDRSKVADEDFDNIPGPTGAMVSDSAKPGRIVIVTGERDGCGWDRNQCAGSVQRKVIDLDDAGHAGTSDVTMHAAQNYADVLIDPPADGYVRAEVYFDVRGHNQSNRETDRDYSSKSRYYDSFEADYATFTSPIYVERTQTSSISGLVRGGPNNDAVPGARVELCRTVPAPRCETLTSGPDGSFGPISVRSGTWRARAFPPALLPGLGTAVLDLGELAPDQHRSVTLNLSPPPTGWAFIDPSGVVVDTDDQPVAGASVVISRAESIDGPFTPLPDGAAELSPANRANPDTTDAAGQFRWDVIAGWYSVDASKPGHPPTIP